MEADSIRDRDLLAAYRDGKRDGLDGFYRQHVADVAAYLRAGFLYTSNERPQRFPGDALELDRNMSTRSHAAALISTS